MRYSNTLENKLAKIGYAKIGRSYNLDANKATSIGGDIDVLQCLRRLALAFPQHEFVLVGKNSGEDPQEMGFPDNVTNPWIEWKSHFPNVPRPEEADTFVDAMRELTGDLHTELDAMIVWAGQHGSANSRIPMIGSDWNEGKSPLQLHGVTEPFITTGGEGILATPQYAFVHYVSWLLDFISRWREHGPGPLKREEIWLEPDPRNYLKCRELRWPNRYPILSQYDFLRYSKHERYGWFPESLTELDPTGYRENSQWVSNTAYCYSGLELTAVGAPPDVPFDPRPGPNRFGMVVNENLIGVKDARLAILEEWIFPNFPDCVIRGHWTEKSQIKIGKAIDPVPYSECAGVMKSFATTLTTPASGSEWATAKPWETFALGSVCFFHPRYDGQFNILPSKDGSKGRYQDVRSRTLADFLRVNSAEELVEKVQRLHDQPELYHTIVTEQRRHYEQAFARWSGGTLAIQDRLLHDLAVNSDVGDYINPGAVWTTKTEPLAAKLKNGQREAPRPRGTNEERKHKAPVSRRKRIRDSVMDEAMATSEPVAEAPDSIVDVPEARPEVREWASQDAGMARMKHEILETVTASIRPGGVLTGGMNFTSFTGASYVPTLRELEAKSKRPSTDEYFLDMAKLVSKRATCLRRAVGCVLVDEDNHVLATGYNGVPSGAPHCNEGHPCRGAGMASGTGLEACEAIHAECNALLQCADVRRVNTVYVTVSPCIHCCKILRNSGATRIVFAEEYVQPEAKELWLRKPGNTWVKL